MNTIKNRNDISILVDKFYAKIRKDELLGPIFTGHISKEKWPEHLSKLTDFWETKLFGIPKFQGNPSLAHINVDKNLNYTVKRTHFDRWLQLWFETIDELYEGELATMAKESASMMAKGQLSTVWQNRP